MTPQSDKISLLVNVCMIVLIVIFYQIFLPETSYRVYLDISTSYYFNNRMSTYSEKLSQHHLYIPYLIFFTKGIILMIQYNFSSYRYLLWPHFYITLFFITTCPLLVINYHNISTWRYFSTNVYFFWYNYYDNISYITLSDNPTCPLLVNN